MPTIALLLVLQVPQDGLVSNADLTRRYSLKDGDARMRAGKFLEAAVAYRNMLLEPGDREAVRLPFALALLAAGETSYDGEQFRRAQLFCPEFSRLRIDLEDLFGSRDAFVRVLGAAEAKPAEGDGADAFGAFAYGRILLGQPKEASEWIARLIAVRGEDAFSKALRDLSKADPPVAPPAQDVPKSVEKIQSRVNQMTGAPAKPLPAGIVAGAPRPSPIAFLEFPMKPREEIFEK